MEDINSFTSTQESMDEFEDNTMDTYSGYSDTEKYQNYMQIVNIVKFFENNGHITEDWMEENKWIIERWRDWIDDYSVINAEVTDLTFRKACSDAETLLSYLIKSIRTTKTFDVKIYHILVTKIKYICDTLFTEEEMEDLMNKMALM
jgi:hypothetical protein